MKEARIFNAARVTAPAAHLFGRNFAADRVALWRRFAPARLRRR
jgi:hypothetical protein